MRYRKGQETQDANDVRVVGSGASAALTESSSCSRQVKTVLTHFRFSPRLAGFDSCGTVGKPDRNATARLLDGHTAKRFWDPALERIGIPDSFSAMGDARWTIRFWSSSLWTNRSSTTFLAKPL